MNFRKCTFALIALLGACTMAFAQTSKGTFAIGGEMSFSGNKLQNSGNQTTLTYYAFGPSLGYFVSDNLMAGLGLDMSIYRYSNDLTTQKRTNMGATPFIRYYKFTSNEQFAFYGEFGFGFAAGKSKIDSNDPTKSRSFNMYLSPGFTWFPTKHWGVDLAINLLNFSSEDPDKDQDDDKINSFRFGLNSFGPLIGIRYFITK